MTDRSRPPTRLEVQTARAQIALNRRTGAKSPDWLLALAATDIGAVVQSEPRPETPSASPAAASRPIPTRRALARLPNRPMQGRDVLDLQRELVQLGYANENLIDGIFGDETETAVRLFQVDYDILNDGVCGLVSQRVLAYLTERGIDREHPPSQKQRHMISFIVRNQQGGFIVFDLLSRGTSLSADRSASFATFVVEQLGLQLEKYIATLTHRQFWMLGTNDLITQDEGQIASFANNIQAELLITLNVADSADLGAGCATYYFGTGDVISSHVGQPLAEAIQAEVVRSALARDRGIHPEYSLLFEQTKAPTVRVEFGNVADAADRDRMRLGTYIDDVAVGIASGINRFYQLGQDENELSTPNIGPTSR